MAGSGAYRDELQHLKNWRPFLLKNSGLPGPRGNLDLAQAVAELATEQQANELLSIPTELAPENSPEVFLVFCGLTSLGMLAARGQHEHFARLRSFASDGRWRVREAVAIALQYVGDADMALVLRTLGVWAKGNWYEKRAVAAALAEPRLLRDEANARQVLGIFDHITRDMTTAPDRRDESYKVLRQSMGYCWSVAAAAAPAEGKALMETWFGCRDTDIQWVMKENLKKNRLLKAAPDWTLYWRKQLARKPKV